MAGLRMSTPHINTFSDDSTPGKTKVSLTSSTMRCSVSRTTTQGWTFGEALSGHWRGPWQIWLGTWGPPLALTIYCVNCQSSLAWWPISMSSCRIFIRWARGVAIRFLPLPWDWKGPLPKSSSHAPEGWQIWRPNSTSGMALSMGWGSISATLSSTSTAPWCTVFPAHGNCPKGREQKWGDLGPGKSEGHSDHWNSGGNGWVEATDCSVNGSTNPDWMRQWPYQHTK